MFLTVGDKIKEARKTYGIKQIAFESYGFSRNYISMIETEKRFLNEDMSKLMYEALCKLSQNKYELVYSYEEFIKTPQQQAKTWLEKNCTIQQALNDYEQFKQIARNYNLVEYRIKIEELLGYHYKKQGDFLKSNKHFLKAAGYCQQVNHNPTSLYKEIGINFDLLCQYNDAIQVLILALEYVDKSDHEMLYRIYFNLAVAYMRSEKYDESLALIEILLNQTEFRFIQASSCFLKDRILRKKGQLELARKVLTEFINSNYYEPYLHYAYHNLGSNYEESGLYQEALIAAKKSLALRHDEKEIALTKALFGRIYFKTEDYKKAEKIYHEIKSTIYRKCGMEQKESLLNWSLQLYWNQKKLKQIGEYLDETKRLVEQSLIPDAVYIEIENRIYKWIMNEVLEQRSSINDYQLLLSKLN